MLDNKEIKEKLEEIIECGGIKAEVAKEAINALEDYDNIEDWFNDLLSHGCSSGMIGGMIYYCDTHNFYDKYYNEIEDLRYEYEEMTGEKLHPNDDLKNWFAWFAYEEIARQLANELEIEV